MNLVSTLPVISADRDSTNTCLTGDPRNLSVDLAPQVWPSPANPVGSTCRSIQKHPFLPTPCLCPCPVYTPLLIPLAWHHPASDAPYSLLFPHAAEGACEHLSQVTLPQLRALCGSVNQGKRQSPHSLPPSPLWGEFSTTLPFAPWTPAT